MSNHATGPRSESGKERAALNAVKHGLRSERPVLPGEDPAEWDAFLAAIVHDLDPGSTLEAELADRVALQLWRLRRAARYEAQVAADECEAALANDKRTAGVSGTKRLDITQPVDTSRQGFGAAVLPYAQCIAKDDPRLK